MSVGENHRCPLCEQANSCALAQGKRTCWCFSARVDEEVLASVPEEARGVRCVCAKCARGGQSLGRSLLLLRQIAQHR